MTNESFEQYDNSEHTPLQWAQDNQEAVESLAQGDGAVSEAARALLQLARGEQPDDDDLARLGLSPEQVPEDGIGHIVMSGGPSSAKAELTAAALEVSAALSRR